MRRIFPPFFFANAFEKYTILVVTSASNFRSVNAGSSDKAAKSRRHVAKRGLTTFFVLRGSSDKWRFRLIVTRELLEEGTTVSTLRFNLLATLVTVCHIIELHEKLRETFETDSTVAAVIDSWFIRDTITWRHARVSFLHRDECKVVVRWNYRHRPLTRLWCVHTYFSIHSWANTENSLPMENANENAGCQENRASERVAASGQTKLN